MIVPFDLVHLSQLTPHLFLCLLRTTVAVLGYPDPVIILVGQEHMTFQIIFENLLEFERGKEPASLVGTDYLVLSSSLSIAGEIQ